MNRRDKKRAKVEHLKRVAAHKCGGKVAPQQAVSLFDKIYDAHTANWRGKSVASIYNSVFCKAIG